MPLPIDVPAFPGPAPSGSFYGEPRVEEPSVSIVNAAWQPRRGRSCPDSRGPCDSGGPQSRFSATRAVRGRTRAPKVPKASRTRRNIVRGYGPTVSHHGDPGTSRKFNELRPLRPAPGTPLWDFGEAHRSQGLRHRAAERDRLRGIGDRRHELLLGRETLRGDPSNGPHILTLESAVEVSA